MKNDPFTPSKNISVKLHKDIFAALKAEAFRRGLTPQEIMAEFARAFVSHSASASRLIDSYCRKKAVSIFKGVYTKPEEQISETDSDAIYDLILSKNILTED